MSFLFVFEMKAKVVIITNAYTLYCVGERKIGVSLSDPALSIAQGYKTDRRNSKENDIKVFEGVVNAYDIAEAVIGFPKIYVVHLGKKYMTL